MRRGLPAAHERAGPVLRPPPPLLHVVRASSVEVGVVELGRWDDPPGLGHPEVPFYLLRLDWVEALLNFPLTNLMGNIGREIHFRQGASLHRVDSALGSPLSLPQH